MSGVGDVRKDEERADGGEREIDRNREHDREEEKMVGERWLKKNKLCI